MRALDVLVRLRLGLGVESLGGLPRDGRLAVRDWVLRIRRRLEWLCSCQMMIDKIHDVNVGASRGCSSEVVFVVVMGECLRKGVLVNILAHLLAL